MFTDSHSITTADPPMFAESPPQLGFCPPHKAMSVVLESKSSPLRGQTTTEVAYQFPCNIGFVRRSGFLFCCT